MKPKGLRIAGTGCLVLILAMLCPDVHAQFRIPEVPNPKVVGIFCPYCNGYMDVSSGKTPTVCPHCHRSLVPKKNVPSPSSPLKLPGQSLPQLQTQDPFGDYLFYDVPIAPADGKLKPRHFETNGLAARAEALGKEMKQIDEQTRQNLVSQQRGFEKEKENLLIRSAGTNNSPALQQLKNVFADDPDVVDLRHLGNSPGTPDLLRQPEAKQPSEYDFPTGSSAGKKSVVENKGLGDDLILGATLARAVATKDATVTLKPYEPEAVQETLAKDGWVIAARDLDSRLTKTGVHLVSGRDDNPYGMHWQILLPDGQSVGYFNGTRTGADGTSLPNIKSDSNTEYKGIVASGKNGAVMTEAVKNVKTRWETQYITDPEGHEYNAGSHNCQDFTGDVLREYQRLLSAQH